MFLTRLPVPPGIEHRQGRLARAARYFPLIGVLVGLIESAEPGHYHYSRPQQIVRCPWHGWEFDLKTGQSKVDPSSIRVRPYPVEVASGEQVKEGPYKAEVFDVSVEDDYVVIEI